MSFKKIIVGLIPSPDLPAELTSKFVDDLPDFLHTHVDDNAAWEIRNMVDPLIGSAEYMNQLMHKAVTLKHKNKWNYVICLTDLPHFMEKNVIMADVNTKSQVALVSIPSFGSFPMKHRLKQLIVQILNDMHVKDDSNVSRVYRKASKNKPLPSAITRICLEDAAPQTKKDPEQLGNMTEDNHKDEKTQEDTDQSSDIRYLIKSKIRGRLRILTGMTFANRPWTALISFKKVLMVAFGTGIYITLFSTPLELSLIYSIPRFLLLMFVAILGMVTWIIFAHRLWEKPSEKGDVRLRKLYNHTTITTLTTIVLINYIVLYCLILGTIGIFVSPGLFEASTDLQESPSIKHYLLLTWLITSLGTLAGSIGTASEDESKIRQITYSYRQMYRYYDIQDKDKENQSTDTVEYKSTENKSH